MLASSFMSFQATPWASHASVALGVVPTLTLTLTLGLVDAWGQRRAPDPSRIFHEALLVWLMGRSVIQLDPRGASCMADGNPVIRFDPRGASCMADGTFSHSTES